MEFTGTFESDRITTYVYDDNDRLLTETTDDDDNNEDRHTVYDWDADDNGTNDSTTQLGKTVFIGLNDQGATEKVVTQAYNARGRLAEFAVDEGGNGTVETEVEYLYDEDGLRVRQVLTENGVQQEVRDFIFDKQNATGYAQAVEELKDGQPDKAYTVGLDVIAQAVATAVGSLQAKDPAFFVYDGHGSVRQLADKLGQVIKIALDDLGSDVLKADYEAYGEAINFAVASAVTTLLYSGEFTDSASGQQYLRARFYETTSGTFNRLDPFPGSATHPLTLHKYAYGFDDPVTHVDPSGELGVVASMVLSSLFGAAVGGVAFGVVAASTGATLNQAWKAAAFGALGGMIIGPATFSPARAAVNERKIILSAAFTAAAIGVTDAAIDAIRTSRGEQPLGGPVSFGKYVGSMARGFAVGAAAEVLDQTVVFKKPTSDIVFDVLGPAMASGAIEILESWLAGSSVDWPTFWKNFGANIVVATASHSAIVGTALKGVGVNPNNQSEVVEVAEIGVSFILTVVGGSTVGGFLVP